MPDFSIEQEFITENPCGVDEAGRGPLAGPVVAAAVQFFSTQPFNEALEINDSKKLSEKKRIIAFNKIPKFAYFGIGIISHEIIDEINILEATKQAMMNAIFDMNSKIVNQQDKSKLCLIDGNIAPSKDGEFKFKTICKGDQISNSIAAASIIAKVTRDKIMEELDILHPEFGWKNNSGYGTKSHKEALNEFGPSQFHRKTFKGVV